MDREPIPLAPICPVCSSRDRVERQRLKGWICSTCWTVFSGGQGEWDRFSSLRAHYTQQRDARLKRERGDAS